MLKKLVIPLTLAIVLFGVLALPVMANTTGNLAVLSLNGDLINNYDFLYSGPYDGTHVDQAVSIIFYGNTSSSSVSKTIIKNALASDGYIYEGSYMKGRCNDGYGWYLQGDKGMKTSATDVNGTHYRLYAYGSYMWDPVFYHKYAFASTHRDLFPLLDYGYGETAEYLICYAAQGHSGWAVFYDYAWFGNYENRVEGSQHWQCDGYGSAIRLP